MTETGKLVALTIVLLLVSFSLFPGGPLSTDVRADTPQSGPVEMSLSLAAAASLNCLSLSSCFVDPGTPFTAVASITSAPAGGYIAYQIDGVHPGLVSKAVRHAAPGVFPIEAPTQGVGTNAFLAAALTGSQPPQPVVTYEGPLVEVDLNCPSAGGVFTLSMRVEGTVGTVVVDQNNDPVAITTTALDADGDTLADKVAAALTVNCVDRLAVDIDGDGCVGARELGSDPTRGGLRDPKNPWDFYDVAGMAGGPDGIIDLLFDILGVIQHYSPGGGPPYDVQFDRGPSTGPNFWNMTAPDGVIDLLTDIVGVITQFGHDCR
ncbi:MAG: hypothetical protein IIC90_10440 [Chloroflexi bacterium]|nr:hypothetical protein [Chloroflexota bacterium]